MTTDRGTAFAETDAGAEEALPDALLEPALNGGIGGGMDETELWVSGLLILILLLLSAFFSGTETAMTGASKARLHDLARRGSWRARIVLDMKAQSERLIGAILLGNNLVNILASAVATSLMIVLLGEAGVALATLVMTLLVLVFSEVMPKTYAINHPERVALALAPVVRGIVLVLAPLTHAVQVFVSFMFRIIGVNVETDLGRASSTEELRGAIDLHRSGSAVDQEERAMLRSILDLGQVEVEEIMTHRRIVETVDANEAPADIVRQVLNSSFTRLPIWRTDPDNVIGVLHAKEVLRAVDAAGGDTSLIDPVAVAAAPWFIPDTTPLIDQLRAFRRRREHIALVVDEYGSLQGIVTLEDILEEIVGEIADEHDVAVSGVRQQPDGSYIVDGTVTIRDLNREFEWDLPDEEASTIAGLVMYKAREIPLVGQEFSFFDFRFRIIRRKRNQITTLRIYPPGAAQPQSSDAATGQDRAGRTS